MPSHGQPDCAAGHDIPGMWLCLSQDVVIVARMSIALKQTHVARRYVDLLRVDSTLMCGAR